MRLQSKEVTHNAIGKEWESINTKWIIICDETDFNGDAKMLLRFGRIDVTQRDYPNDGIGHPKEEMTWFKGLRTITFDITDKKDKQKMIVIQIVNDFLLKNDIDIERKYKPVDINK
jgi:hypothetical protein